MHALRDRRTVVFACRSTSVICGCGLCVAIHGRWDNPKFLTLYHSTEILRPLGLGQQAGEFARNLALNIATIELPSFSRHRHCDHWDS